MEYIVFGSSVIAVIIIARFLAAPLKVVLKLLLNIAFGILLMVLVNIMGAKFGFHIPFNYVTAGVSGFLGIPGVILLTILEFII